MISFKQIEKLAVDNSPLILTVVGVVGTITTAVLTHRAATKTTFFLMMEDEDRQQAGLASRTKKEVVEVTWKNYIPPAIVGTLTITSIVGANRIGTRRAAALASAYAVSERAYSEYREKVIEKIGDSKERAVRDEIAQDRVTKNPPAEDNVVIVGTGDVLCCDLFTGRYFNSAIEELKKAQNDTNYQILHNGYASVTDFYDRIGLPRTDVSDQLGWNQDKLLELEFTTCMTEDGRPCIAYRFHSAPLRSFDRLHP